MGKVLPFKAKTLKQKHKGKTLCANGHHKWKLLTNTRFDVKQGKLVSVYKCERCSREKNRLLD